MIELQQKRIELESLLMDELKTCRQSGIQLAENEAEYRKKLRIEILHERDKGTPVTIIGDVCRGKDEIADLKRARDAAEAIYKSSQEAINVYKLRLRFIKDEMPRYATGDEINERQAYDAR